MNIKGFIGLLAGGLAIYWYKQELDARYRDELAKSRAEYLDVINELEDKVNPDNDDADRIPLSIKPLMNIGDTDLQEIDLQLVLENKSDIPIEIGDFRCFLYIGGYLADKLVPSNVSKIYIAPRSKFNFILYRNDWKPFDSSSLESAVFPNKTNCYIDLSFLWYVANDQIEIIKHKISVSATYMGDKWNASTPYIGYNAAVVREREDNESYWYKYDE